MNGHRDIDPCPCDIGQGPGLPSYGKLLSLRPASRSRDRHSCPPAACFNYLSRRAHAMALDLSIVRRAIAIRIESVLGVDLDGDMTVGEKVEWIDDCVELFANLA